MPPPLGRSLEALREGRLRLGSAGISAVGAPLAAISQRLPGADPSPPRAALSLPVASSGRRQVSAPPAWLLTPSSPAPGLRPRRGPSGRPVLRGRQPNMSREGRAGGGRGAGAEGGREAGRASTCGRTWSLRDVPRTGSERAGLTRTEGRRAGVRGGGRGMGAPGAALLCAPRPGPMHGSWGRLQ